MGIRKRLGLVSNANTCIIELESASFRDEMMQILQIWAKSREKKSKKVGRNTIKWGENCIFANNF